MESFSIPLYFLTSFYRSITADAMPMPVYICFASLQLHAHAQLVTYEVQISEIDARYNWKHACQSPVMAVSRYYYINHFQAKSQICLCA